MGRNAGAEKRQAMGRDQAGCEIRRDDFTVSYRDHAFRALFKVTGAIHDAELAEVLWGHGTNEDYRDLSWEYMFFLDKIAAFDVYSTRVFQGHTGPLNQVTADDTKARIESATGISLP